MAVDNQNPSQRIKGQETSILITSGNQLQDTLVDIQNFEMEVMFELISKGYLGETSERKDFIFKGCKFSLELHLHTQDWFAFQLQMKQKAQRILPGLIFNITTVLNFPNGDNPSVTLPDCSFGPNPLRVTSRGDYVSVKLEGEVGDYTPTLS